MKKETDSFKRGIQSYYLYAEMEDNPYTPQTSREDWEKWIMGRLYAEHSLPEVKVNSGDIELVLL